jgi:hypothetical protein
MGRRIASVVDAHVEPGGHVCQWNGRDLHGDLVHSGVYHIRLEALGTAEIAKLVVTR